MTKVIDCTTNSLLRKDSEPLLSVYVLYWSSLWFIALIWRGWFLALVSGIKSVLTRRAPGFAPCTIPDLWMPFVL